MEVILHIFLQGGALVPQEGGSASKVGGTGEGGTLWNCVGDKPNFIITPCHGIAHKSFHDLPIRAKE